VEESKEDVHSEKILLKKVRQNAVKSLGNNLVKKFGAQ
jgi:hypothetical protein